MKFFVVNPSPLSFLIPLGSEYSPQDPVFKYYSFNVRYRVSNSVILIIVIIIPIIRGFLSQW